MADFEFRKYRRIQIAELRPVNLAEINSLRKTDGRTLDGTAVSISDEDIKAGSPKLGDMIARNPKNHADQWLVAAAYFAENFAPDFNRDHAYGLCTPETCADCIALAAEAAGPVPTEAG